MSYKSHLYPSFLSFSLPDALSGSTQQQQLGTLASLMPLLQILWKKSVDRVLFGDISCLAQVCPLPQNAMHLLSTQSRTQAGKAREKKLKIVQVKGKKKSRRWWGWGKIALNARVTNVLQDHMRQSDINSPFTHIHRVRIHHVSNVQYNRHFSYLQQESKKILKQFMIPRGQGMYLSWSEPSHQFDNWVF